MRQDVFCRRRGACGTHYVDIGGMYGDVVLARSQLTPLLRSHPSKLEHQRLTFNRLGWGGR